MHLENCSFDYSFQNYLNTKHNTKTSVPWPQVTRCSCVRSVQVLFGPDGQWPWSHFTRIIIKDIIHKFVEFVCNKKQFRIINYGLVEFSSAFSFKQRRTIFFVIVCVGLQVLALQQLMHHHHWQSNGYFLLIYKER